MYEKQIGSALKIQPTNVGAVIGLLDSGNTVPFIARYRKEVTGSLDEEQIREIQLRVKRFRSVDERRETIVNTIKEQGNLTDELHQKLRSASTLTALEDLYMPYKPKRKTKASIAVEHGLQPLADMIINQDLKHDSLTQAVQPFLNDFVTTVDQALEGARSIVAETISEHSEIRRVVRKKALKHGVVICKKIKNSVDNKQVFKLYYAFESPVDRLRPHQILAFNRGEAEKILRIKVEINQPDWLLPIRSHYRPDRRSPFSQQMQLAIEDGAARLLLPAISRDVRRWLTERAEAHAIKIFAQNMRGLLNQPPLKGMTLLAVDPAYRTGCKVAVIDTTGKLLETTTIYPHQPKNQWDEALKTLSMLVRRHEVGLIAIGNGTASRETEKLAAELTSKLDSVRYLIVNEAGASVYSASKLARNELPDLDVSIRGAVSIGRRVLDPLAELVKIDPKSIGVGLYQHDVDQKQLSEALEGVVESVVNQVGVDANTASPALLTYVSGIGPKLAEKMVAYRDENGRFRSRTEFVNVNGLGTKAFEQSAGFLRIQDGENPFDASAIHPESYRIAAAIMDRAAVKLDEPLADREAKLSTIEPTEILAQELGTGLPTLVDILEQLVRPGRDPRSDLQPPLLRSDVLTMDDLKPDMVLTGTVRNVVDFGTFIDIGVKQDGLLHRSQIPRSTFLNVGDILKVKLLNVDKARGRISLGWFSDSKS